MSELMNNKLNVELSIEWQIFCFKSKVKEGGSDFDTVTLENSNCCARTQKQKRENCIGC